MEVATLKARMDNPAVVVPDAMEALQAVAAAAKKGGVPAQTLELAHLRASQINGCSVCVDIHSHSLEQLGESYERIGSVVAWREAPFYTDAERVALALTEAVTRLNDQADPVPDELWDEARGHYDESALGALVLSIGLVNLWNRLCIATGQVAGVATRRAAGLHRD